MVHLIFASPKNPEAQEKFILIDGSQMADSYRHYITMLRNNRTTTYTSEITIIVCITPPTTYFLSLDLGGLCTHRCPENAIMQVACREQKLGLQESTHFCG